jgi:hypothetical protein
MSYCFLIYYISNNIISAGTDKVGVAQMLSITLESYAETHINKNSNNIFVEYKIIDSTPTNKLKVKLFTKIK